MEERDKITIVGAGPGDPELITLKGKRALEEADLILYTGSLINPQILSEAKADLRDSSGLALEEMIEVMSRFVGEGKKVVRLHDGDPSLYGAIQEEVDELKKKGIECDIIPGVSSLFASAAAIKKELTLPGVSQTVIITRAPGRTPGITEEEFVSLLKERGTFAIFLSSGMMDRVASCLREAGRSEEDEVAVVYKASWPEQEIIMGKVKDIASKVKERGIKKSAIIIVGDIFRSENFRSKLYDKNFSHGFREAI